jgi:hypothetical protein
MTERRKEMIKTGQLRVKESKVTKRLTYTANSLTVDVLSATLTGMYSNKEIQYRIKSIEVQLPVDADAGVEITAFGRLYELRAFSVTNRNLVIKPDEMTIYDM